MKKFDLPISDYYFDFFESKLGEQVHLVIDGIPFFADFEMYSLFRSDGSGLICSFFIDSEVNDLSET